ncbi:hypothetical protein FGIG_12526 [Fasciola gigantica]|uniref:Uncharacterized protein n=1 Tax=Fasciola gigantica TaxID=46835 RepID=A0A504Y4H3_FASGI|nr:hypothetical protein FGIG_12526 [Fasciola gigantica]
MTHREIVKAAEILEAGSDAKRVTLEFVQRHGLESKPVSLLIGVVGSTRATRSDKVQLQLSSLVDTGIVTPHAVSTDSLPVRPIESTKAVKSQLQHPRAIFEKQRPHGFEKPSGFDEPESPWVQD